MKILYNRTDLLAAAKYLSKKNKPFARDFDWTVNWLESFMEDEAKKNFSRNKKDFVCHTSTGGVLLTFSLEDSVTMGVGIHVTPTFKESDFIEVTI